MVGAIAGRFVLDGASERSAAGTLEFHDLLVLARRLLATRPDVRARLHDHYRRVLLDEFQDTDPIQLEIAVRLTAPPLDQPADDVSGLRPVPGRLFVVGDPKQSIYRFRRADIAMYLAAAGQVGAEREVLSANFRSTDAVIDWVNGVFGNVIQPEPSVQPAYGPLDACRPGSRDHGTVHVLGATAHDESTPTRCAGSKRSPSASPWSPRSATSGRSATATAACARAGPTTSPSSSRRARRCRCSRRRSSRLTIPYRAENSSVVYVTPEIRSLMLALRAGRRSDRRTRTRRRPAHAAVRLQRRRTVRVEAGRGSWRSYARAPESMADHPVAAAIGHIASIARDIGRSTPAELLDRIVVERRMLETALGGRDARDVWRRVRYVVDQARAWTDAGGRGVRRYLRWAAYQAAEGRASDTILPERDHDAVRVMTVHAAKGLEFPITIVSGLTTKPQGQPALSVVWPDGGWMLAERDNDEFQAYKPLDEQMGDAERRRLLYVACTRAVDHLVVSLHRKAENVDGEQGTSKSTSATVLAVGGGLDHGARPLEGTVIPITPTVADDLELPWSDHAEWEAERRRAITEASVRSATSATGLATAMAEAAAASDEGLQKDAVDLDLPPWQRGRYGTAIGRAVHAVLQDADLVTGSDIDELAAAQCAAEGIFGLEARVAALSRSALTAPIVVAAAEGAEHWRELFVVAELGGTVVEGYIDLLVRTAEGLVIVDYKTDQWRPGTDKTARIARYRHQLAAYGLVLGRLLDEPIVGGVLVRCRPDEPAEQITLDAMGGGPRRKWRQAPLQVLSNRGPAAHGGSLLAGHRGGADDGAGTLDDTGDQPAHGDEGEDHGEGDTERKEDRAGDAPLGITERTDHAGVDRRAVDVHRPHRVLDDRAGDVALRRGDHLVAAERRFRLANLGDERRRFRIEAGADQVLLALLEELGVGAEAHVDDAVVGVAVDGARPCLIDPETAGLERRVLRRAGGRAGLDQGADEHHVWQRRCLASGRHGDEPPAAVGNGRCGRWLLRLGGGSGQPDGERRGDSDAGAPTPRCPVVGGHPGKGRRRPADSAVTDRGHAPPPASGSHRRRGDCFVWARRSAVRRRGGRPSRRRTRPVRRRGRRG